MRRYLYGFLGVIVAAYLALAIIPPFIPLDHYKSLIQEQVSNSCGHNFVIDGSIRLRMLPTPHVAFKRVRLSNSKGFSKPHMARVEEMDVYASIFSLLRGRLVISQVYLIEPDIVLEQDPHGHNNWTLTPKAQVSPTSLQQDASVAVELKTIIFKGGRLRYKDKTQCLTFYPGRIIIKGDLNKGRLLFKADFSWLGHSIHAHITSKGLTHKSSIPLKGLMTIDGHSLKIKGDYDSTHYAFKGLLRLRTPTRAQPAVLRRIFKQSVILHTPIDVNTDRLLLTSIHLKSGALNAVGSVRFGFKANTPHEVRFSSLPGETILRLQGNGGSKTGHNWQGDVSLSSHNILALFDWLQLPYHPDLHERMKDLRLDFRYGFSPASITIRHLKARTGQIQLTGDLAYECQHLTIDLKTPHFNTLLKLAGLSSPVKEGAAALKGRFQGDLQQLQGDAQLHMLGGTLKCKGKFFDLLSQPRYTIRFQSHHPNMNTLLAGFHLPLKGVHLGSLNIQADVSGNFKEVALRNLEGFIKPHKKPYAFSGSGTCMLDGKRPHVSGELRLSDINLNDFLPKIPAAKEQSDSALFGFFSTPQPEFMQTALWSTSPINFKWLQSFDGSLLFKAASMTVGGYTLKNMSATFNNTIDGLTISPIKAVLLKGPLEGSLSLTHDASASLHLILACRKASLDHLFASTGADKLIGGNLNINLDLTSRGSHMRALVSNMNGKVNLHIRDGLIYGFDLEALNQNLKSLQSVSAFLDLLHTYLNKGQTRFSSFNARFDVQQGVARCHAMKFISSPLTAQGQSHIDIVRWHMKSNATFAFTSSKNLPSFALRIEGPLDKLKHTLDTEKLQSYLLGALADNTIGALLPTKLFSFLPFLSDDSIHNKLSQRHASTQQGKPPRKKRSKAPLQKEASSEKQSNSNQQEPLSRQKTDKKPKKALKKFFGY